MRRRCAVGAGQPATAGAGWKPAGAASSHAATSAPAACWRSLAGPSHSILQRLGQNGVRACKACGARSGPAPPHPASESWLGLAPRAPTLPGPPAAGRCIQLGMRLFMGSSAPAALRRSCRSQVETCAGGRRGLVLDASSAAVVAVQHGPLRACAARSKSRCSADSAREGPAQSRRGRPAWGPLPGAPAPTPPHPHPHTHLLYASIQRGLDAAVAVDGAQLGPRAQFSLPHCRQQVCRRQGSGLGPAPRVAPPEGSPPK